jgi:hypothetical protein
MTARVVLGKRNNEFGLWASPPGVDALTASPSQLILQMTNLVDQIILVGAVGSSQVVPLGLSDRPLVLLISKGTHPTFGTYAARPSPLGTDVNNTSVAVNAASMSINTSRIVSYLVFRRAF